MKDKQPKLCINCKFISRDANLTFGASCKLKSSIDLVTGGEVLRLCSYERMDFSEGSCTPNGYNFQSANIPLT